ncbi:MAG TPA: DNA polymerase III subunit delta' [Anaeromyxobacteraceae bacterium]|nr:DNA polymerase III subunit delta' [Anaeromyxobacteraceae bacterium]
MPFADLIGQERALDPLRAALARGALHHAYLFAGPEGVGKGTAARLLAQAANCERVRAQGQPEEAGTVEEASSARRRAEAEPQQSGDAGGMGGRERLPPRRAQDQPAHRPGAPSPASPLPDACGECLPCRKIARGVHPDVMVVAEERVMARAGTWEPRGGRSPSRDIVVDQIREVVDRRLSLRRLEARRRFVILDPADAMNPQAQNALLKTLEEPPDDTTLVLVAAAADGLLPTVRSRCLRVGFRPLPPALVEERLSAAGHAPGLVRLAAALSGGSLGKALSLDDEALQARRQAVEQAAALDASDARGWIAFASERGKDREAARETCELLAVWLRDVLARAVAGERAAPALLDLERLTAAAAARLSPRQVLRRIEGVQKALQALGQNASPALALEGMLIGWFHGG